MLEKKRILITGASGFIGKHLLRALKQTDNEVFILCRRLASLESHIDDEHLIMGDLEKPETFTGELHQKEIQIVFHLAGRVVWKEIGNTMAKSFQLHLHGTANLFEALNDKHIEMFVNASSSSVYGKNPVPLKEDAQLKPLSIYGLSKMFQEEVVWFYHRTYDIPCVNLRPFMVYGPEQPDYMFAVQAVQAALHGRELQMTFGEQKRDFIYIDDVISAMLKAAEQPEVNGQSLNIATGTPVTIKTAAEMIYQLSGSQIEPSYGAKPYRADETFEHYAEVSLAEKLLDWKAKTMLENGLKKMITHYRMAG